MKKILLFILFLIILQSCQKDQNQFVNTTYENESILSIEYMIENKGFPESDPPKLLLNSSNNSLYLNFKHFDYLFENNQIRSMPKDTILNIDYQIKDSILALLSSKIDFSIFPINKYFGYNINSAYQHGEHLIVTTNFREFYTTSYNYEGPEQLTEVTNLLNDFILEEYKKIYKED